MTTMGSRVKKAERLARATGAGGELRTVHVHLAPDAGAAYEMDGEAVEFDALPMLAAGSIVLLKDHPDRPRGDVADELERLKAKVGEDANFFSIVYDDDWGGARSPIVKPGAVLSGF